MWHEIVDVLDVDVVVHVVELIVVAVVVVATVAIAVVFVTVVVVVAAVVVILPGVAFVADVSVVEGIVHGGWCGFVERTASTPLTRCLAVTAIRTVDGIRRGRHVEVVI